MESFRSVFSNRKNYKAALADVKDMWHKAKGVKKTIGSYAADVAKKYEKVDGRQLMVMAIKELGIKEEHGAGEEATKKLRKKYKKDTPGQSCDEAFSLFMSEEVSQRELKALEIYADRLLQKFDVDIEFTKHFADRMNDTRNKPMITTGELVKLFQKIAKDKAEKIKKHRGAEAVLNDIQSDLNLPIVIKLDKNKGEIEVVNKTIMRKKDFKTPDKKLRY